MVNKSYCIDIKITLDDSLISHNVVLQNHLGIVFRKQLNKGDFIHISAYNKRCRVCHEIRNLNEDNICNECYASLEFEEDEHLIRRDCLYYNDTSLLSKYGFCTPNSPLCKSSKNVDYCHSRFILYVGRYNDRFKVGISNRSRGLYTRIIEQGLDEAIIIDGPVNLTEALLHEDQLASELQLDKKITHREKLLSYTGTTNDFTMEPITGILEDYIKSSFDINKIDIHYYHRNDPIDQHDYQIVEFDHQKVDIRGVIERLQGSIITLSQDDQYYLFDLKQFIGREVMINDSIAY